MIASVGSRVESFACLDIAAGNTLRADRETYMLISTWWRLVESTLQDEQLDRTRGRMDGNYDSDPMSSWLAVVSLNWRVEEERRGRDAEGPRRALEWSQVW